LIGSHGDAAAEWLRLRVEAVGVREGIVHLLCAGHGIHVLGNVEGPEYARNRDEETVLGEQLSGADAAALDALSADRIHGLSR